MKLFKTIALVTLIALQAAPKDLFCAPHKKNITNKKVKTKRLKTKTKKEHKNHKQNQPNTSSQKEASTLRVSGFATASESVL